MRRAGIACCFALVGLAGLAAAHPAAAQIATDGTVGPQVSLPGANEQVPADLGEYHGGNLFHSFDEFHVQTGGSATFVPSATDSRGVTLGAVDHLISRVTGGDPSSVDGLLRSNLGESHFFLVNPAGVVFGPNASVDVPGSFHVSTADELRFADGAVFSAVAPAGPVLTSAPPSAFGFLGPDAGSIRIQESILQVLGGDLTLAGGEIEITGGSFGFLNVPGGRIDLVAVDSAGALPFAPAGPPDVGDFAALGPVNLSDFAFLSVAEPGGDAGSIFVRGAELGMEASFLVADDGEALFGAGSLFGFEAGGLVDVNVSGNLRIDLSDLLVDTGGLGNAGSIRLRAGGSATLELARLLAGSSDGSGGPVEIEADGDLSLLATSVETATTGVFTDAGDVRLAAGNDLRLDGVPLAATGDLFSGRGGDLVLEADRDLLVQSSSLDTSSFGFDRSGGVLATAGREVGISDTRVFTATAGLGAAGPIAIAGGTIRLENGSILTASTLSSAPGGAVSLEAGESVLLQDSNIPNTAAAEGDAGPVAIRAPAVTLAGGSLVSTSPAASGRGGDVTVEGGTVLVGTGSGILSVPSGADTGLPAGRGGDIGIEATESVEIRGLVAAGSLGDGDSGDVHIAAPRVEVVDGGAVNALSSDFVLPGNLGDAGDITVEADVVEIRNGGNLSGGIAGPTAAGAGGAIVVEAAERLLIRGTEGDETGIFNGIQGTGDAGPVVLHAPLVTISDGGIVESQTLGSGSGGSIDIDAETLRILRGGAISTTTDGSGPGGSIDIDVAGSVRIEGRGPEGGRSAILSASSGSGPAGSVGIRARELAMEDEGLVSAEAIATGEAGSVEIAVDDASLTDSEVTSQSEGPGDAGRIELDVSDTLELLRSRITTEAADGFGGSIAINGERIEEPVAGTLVAVKEAGDAPGTLIRLEDSEISTSVGAGVGDGGNVLIDPKFLVLDDSTIAANAVGGDGGNILIVSDFVFADGDLTDLVQASSQQGVSGTISITSPSTDVTAGITPLEADFLDPAALLRPRCAARGPQGSLTVARRQGLPLSPEGLLVAHAELPPVAPAAVPDTPEMQVAQRASRAGATAFRGGDFERAASEWRRAERLFAEIAEPEARTRALRGLARSQQARGEHAASLDTLAVALELAEAAGEPAALAGVLGDLGNAQLALGRPDAARRLLARGLAIARDAGEPQLAAELQNNLANERVMRGDFAEAIAAYEGSAREAARAGDVSIEVRALSNAARAALEADRPERAAELLARAHARAEALPPDARVDVWIHLARSDRRLAERSPADREASLLRAHAALSSAVRLARERGDERALSFALGNLGALYRSDGRLDEALLLTRRAQRAAERAAAPDPLYRWHAQAGEILWAQGRPNESFRARRRAVEVLEETRQESLARYDASAAHFRRTVAPVYRDLAAALLEGSDLVDDEAARQVLFREARGTMELLRAAELRDYFRNECVADLEARTIAPEDVAGDAAIVYPVVLPDRLELLVSTGAGITRHTVPVSATELERAVRHFRRTLRLPLSHAYREPARDLHRWLVAPYAAELRAHGVDTLVFVPDAPLLGVAFAALHDGEAFLAERFALAVTPGLALVDPRPLDPARARLLLAGLSEGGPGFARLPRVEAEIGAIRELYGGEVLLNESFRAEAIERELREDPPTVLHLASHAVFTGDPGTSFLLTHGDRLTLDRLADAVGATRFRSDPLELLVLSACETAAGDERAALGLAGVAIRSGARSAVGSLWAVSDEAAQELMVAFYAEMGTPDVTKAEALARAQRRLLADSRFEHPFYWSPYLVISNWL